MKMLLLQLWIFPPPYFPYYLDFSIFTNSFFITNRRISYNALRSKKKTSGKKVYRTL